jgi:hypothetical protein
MKVVAIVLVVIVLLVAGYLLLGKNSLPTLPNQNTPQSQPPSNLPKEVEVPLNTQNNSNELGVATLQKVNGKLVVKINLKGQTDNTPQPAHIHLGSCPNVGVVKYPLNPVVNGSSETILDTTGDDLPKLLPLSINVHKSDSQMQTYVACGDIKL